MTTTETATADGILLYGYKDVLGEDPHERIIELSPETYARLGDFQAKEWKAVGRYAIGTFFALHDVNGVEWEVASAPCGAGCHCAAVIREIA